MCPMTSAESSSGPDGRSGRAALSPLVAGVDGILFSDALVADGALVAKAYELGLEGADIRAETAGNGSSRRTRPLCAG
jgi:hypothetical protein